MFWLYVFIVGLATLVAGNWTQREVDSWGRSDTQITKIEVRPAATIASKCQDLPFKLEGK